MIKHVGKMKHNNAKVCVVYRTLPGDAYSALVVGTGSLSDVYHNSLMTLVESQEGQQANELGDSMSNRYFPDGTNMLQQLHLTGKLVKVPTTSVLMIPTPNTEIPLDELNLMIAEQKGVTLDELAIKAEMTPVKNDEAKEVLEQPVQEPLLTPNEVLEQPTEVTAEMLRSKADQLLEEAKKLQEKANELDPPKTRRKKQTTSAEKNKETT